MLNERIRYLRPSIRMVAPAMIGAAVACASTAPGTTGATQVLRVMSYNIHHGAGNDACVSPPAVPGRLPNPDCGLDLERIAAVIRAARVDVAGLQEVDRFWARSSGVDQAAALGAMLNMQTCYGANLTHDADAHAAVPHEYGTLILSRHPIASCGNTLLPRAGAASEQRGLLKAGIRAGAALLDFYDTHLHTQEADRRVQIDAVLRQLGAQAAPVILVGDLNARPTEPYIAPLLAVLADVWAASGSGPGFTSPASPRAPARRRIDYILVSPDLHTARAAVLDDGTAAVASDHYPVIADVVLPASGRPISKAVR